MAEVKEIDAYNEDLSFAEDYDLWLRLGRRGTLANLPRLMVDYNLGSGMSDRNKKKQVFYRARILRLYGRYYPGRVRAWVRLAGSVIISYTPGLRAFINRINKG